MYVMSKSPQQTRTYMQVGHFMMSVDYTYLTNKTCVCEHKVCASQSSYSCTLYVYTVHTPLVVRDSCLIFKTLSSAVTLENT